MHFILTVFIALLVTIGAALAEPEGATEQAWRASALKESATLTSEHSYFKSGALIDKLLLRYPRDAAVHLAAARLYRDMGLFARAESEYQAVLVVDPNSTQSFVALSDIYLQKLNVPKAIVYARRAFNSNPRATDARLALVAALLAGGMFKEAELELNTLIQADGRNAQVQYVSYKLALARAQYAQAQRHLEEAVALAPARPDWLVDLGELYRTQGDYGNACRYLERALTIDPYSLEALTKLAIVYEFYLHDYDRAMQSYRSILAIDQDSVTALAGLDRCKIKKNDIAGALRFQLQNAVSNAVGFFNRPRGE